MVLAIDARGVEEISGSSERLTLSAECYAGLFKYHLSLAGCLGQCQTDA